MPEGTLSMTKAERERAVGCGSALRVRCASARRPSGGHRGPPGQTVGAKLAAGRIPRMVSRQRGHPSHRGMSEALRSRTDTLPTETYPDFRPSLAAERLLDRDGVKISAPTVGRIRIDQGMWGRKRPRATLVFQLRDRRPPFGELIQIGGSPHDWFEGWVPGCTLIVFIDDVTGRLTAMRCAPLGSCKAYLGMLREHVLRKVGRGLSIGVQKLTQGLPLKTDLLGRACAGVPQGRAARPQNASQHYR